MSDLKTTLLSKGVNAEMLYDVIHDAASKLATNANDGGLDSQLDFLFNTCGWHDQDVLDILAISEELRKVFGSNLYVDGPNGNLYQPFYKEPRDDVDANECTVSQIKYKPE